MANDKGGNGTMAPSPRENFLVPFRQVFDELQKCFDTVGLFPRWKITMLLGTSFFSRSAREITRETHRFFGFVGQVHFKVNYNRKRMLGTKRGGRGGIFSNEGCSFPPNWLPPAFFLKFSEFFLNSPNSVPPGTVLPPTSETLLRFCEDVHENGYNHRSGINLASGVRIEYYRCRYPLTSESLPSLFRRLPWLQRNAWDSSVLICTLLCVFSSEKYLRSKTTNFCGCTGRDRINGPKFYLPVLANQYSQPNKNCEKYVLFRIQFFFLQVRSPLELLLFKVSRTIPNQQNILVFSTVKQKLPGKAKRYLILWIKYQYLINRKFSSKMPAKAATKCVQTKLDRSLV